MSDYSTLIVADAPALYWMLNETSGTTISDSSGNSRGGKIFTNQAVSNSGCSLAQPGATRGGDKALKMNGTWNYPAADPPTTQSQPGTGVRADAYKPYQPGSLRTFECWAYRDDPFSFSTMFSSSGDTGGALNAPHPTLEWGSTDGTVAGAGATFDKQMVRWYPNVNSVASPAFAGGVDWGSTDHPTSSTCRNEFKLKKWNHVVFTFNDSTSIAELYVNGRSQGQAGPTGTGSTTLHYDSTNDTGLFQIGWRGNFGTPNSEVWGGLLQHVAVYHRILTAQEVDNHWRAGATGLPYLSPMDPATAKQGIELALTGYFR